MLFQLSSAAVQVRSEVSERIVYAGEEEEQEKQQGRERNSRQRAVALVIKQAQVRMD